MTTSSAKDLGVYGETFPIAEENLLQVIQNRLKTMAANGELIKAQQELAQKATQKIRLLLP